MDLSSFTLEQLKTLHNDHLARGREESQKALHVRNEIVRREPSYRGSSLENLASGLRSLFLARTFANTPYDLPESENEYR